MGWFRALAIVVLLVPAAASPLVTGNGFGFAVVDPATGDVTKFYAHPYSFTRPDPKDPLGEGVPTANFYSRIFFEAPARAAYVDQSHVIRSDRATLFMPFGLDRAALIIVTKDRFTGKYAAKPSSQSAVAGGVMVCFAGVEECVLKVPLAGQDKLTAWAEIAVTDKRDAERAVAELERWRGVLTPQELVDRELADFERWRAPAPPLRSEDERKLWRQSETLLRMAQSREPNRPDRYSNGLIVAALPDGSWFTPWVRDMAWAAMALLRMGHRAEARAALLAYFNARPTGLMKAETGSDYQISVARYFGNGAEEPFFTQEGATNIELDDWGAVLWLLGEYVQRTGDTAIFREPTARGPLYDSARDYVVKPLFANLEAYGGGLIVAADTSIWEERQKDKKHFAFTTAMAMAGLRAFAPLADNATRSAIGEKLALLEKGFAAAFLRDGLLRGTLEEGIKNDIDGALLAVINLGLVSDTTTIASTADRMALLKVASGGYKRVRSTYTDPKVYEYWYERQEFIFVDLQLAEVYRRLGRHADADAMLTRIVEKAAGDHYFVPEMLVAEDCALFHGALGDPTGAIPMVGYGAGAYVLHVLERENRP